MEAKLATKPLSTDGLVKMAYAEELANEEKMKARKSRPYVAIGLKEVAIMGRLFVYI